MYKYTFYFLSAHIVFFFFFFFFIVRRKQKTSLKISTWKRLWGPLEITQKDQPFTDTPGSPKDRCRANIIISSERVVQDLEISGGERRFWVCEMAYSRRVLCLVRLGPQVWYGNRHRALPFGEWDLVQVLSPLTLRMSDHPAPQNNGVRRYNPGWDMQCYAVIKNRIKRKWWHISSESIRIISWNFHGSSHMSMHR